MKKISLLAFACVLAFHACKKDEDNQPQPPVTEKISLGKVTDPAGQTAELWADDTLVTGYNRIYFSLKDTSGAIVKDIPVTYSSLMDMGSMQHGSPVEQPVFNETDRLFEGAVVFTMESHSSDDWMVNVNDAAFPVFVKPAATKMTGSYSGADGKSYVLTLVPLQKWQTGMNDFEILINRMDGMMSFPPAENLEIEFYPDMPSMGHSSPNNVNPVSTGKGHYRGKVNFTMTGDWTLHFKIKENGAEIVEDATIDIRF